MNARRWMKSVLAGLLIFTVLTACAPATPQVVEKVVEKTVVQTVVVEKEVPVEVEKKVVETVVVPEKRTQLSFAGHEYFNMSFGPAPAPLEFMRQQVAENYPDIDIQLLLQPLDANKWHDNLVTYWMAKDPTMDLLYVVGYWITEFAEAGWLMPLDDKVDPALVAKYDQAYRDIFSHEGKLYALGPAWGGIGGLYYRKDLLEQYGLNPPETYDDLIAACDTIRKDNPDLGCWDWPAMRNIVLINRWSEFLHGFGGTYFNEDGTCAMNSPEAVEALEFMKMLFDKGYTPQEALSWKEEDSNVRFVSGQTIFLSGRNDILFWIDDPAKSKIVGKWGFMPNPAQPGGQHAGFPEFWGFAVSAHTDNPEEALKVLELWASFPNMKNFNLSQGPIQGHSDVYTDPDVLAANPNLPLIEEIAKTAIPSLPSANYGEVADILQAQIHSVLSGQMAPQQALDDACAAIDAIEMGD